MNLSGIYIILNSILVLLGFIQIIRIIDLPVIVWIIVAIYLAGSNACGQYVINTGGK